MSRPALRKTLSTPGLLREVRHCFQSIDDDTAGRSFTPAPILREDGTSKNDCERAAAKRLLTEVRREHPHLKLIVVEDALASNGPHIKLLQSLKMRFILGVKPGDHECLFYWVATMPGVKTAEITGQDGTVHRFRYLNGAPVKRHPL